MESRHSYVFNKDAETTVAPIEGMDKKAMVIFPIIVAGDVTGAVALLQNDANKIPSETETKLTQAAAEFLGKQME